jgi:hypothetical protein
MQVTPQPRGGAYSGQISAHRYLCIGPIEESNTDKTGQQTKSPAHPAPRTLTCTGARKGVLETVAAVKTL